MRFVHRVVLIALVLVTALSVVSLPALAAVKKKGVSAANFSGVAGALSDVGAGWFYTWASDKQGIANPSGVEFVPMIWGQGSVNSAQLNQAKALGSTLLAFNEPDMGGQANMAVERALELWPQLQGTGMRLGAPAVAFGGDTAGGWLDRFMSGAAARGYRVDFIPLHWYGGDFSSAAVNQLKGYLQNVYNRYRKPIWLTEYALIDFSTSTPRYPSSEQQAAFAKNSATMLQGTSFVERYSWFTLSTTTHRTGLYTGSTPNATGVAYRSVG